MIDIVEILVHGAVYISDDASILVPVQQFRIRWTGATTGAV